LCVEGVWIELLDMGGSWQTPSCIYIGSSPPPGGEAYFNRVPVPQFLAMDTALYHRFFIPTMVGIGMHLAFFIRGEWHLQAPLLLVSHLACFCILLGTMKHAAFWSITGYVLGLFSSILIYRVFFHRLRHFPGPLGARASKLWHVWKLQTGHQNHFLLPELHKRYGDFIRTGQFAPG
jgi:Na+(H+)/acetate symporter ActP